MARKPMITRTITTTKATVLCLDIQKGEPFNETVVLPRTYKDEKAMMKAISPILDTETVKAVHIVDTEVCETLYGMTEQQFIEAASVLPPRNA